MLSLRWEQIFLKKFIKKSFNAKLLEALRERRE